MAKANPEKGFLPLTSTLYFQVYAVAEVSSLNATQKLKALPPIKTPFC
jgi:hypothetical protein